MTILTNVQDLLFYKHNKRYQQLSDRLDQLDLAIKTNELERLQLDKERLEIEMMLYHLEREIAGQVLGKS